MNMRNCEPKWKVAAALMLLTFSTLMTVAGQTVSPTPLISRQRVNLNFILGSVEIPTGFKGYMTANWNDAWAGYIEDKDSTWKIGWAAGLIQYISETRKKELVWQKEETTESNTTKLSLFRNKDGDTLVAKIGWLEFDVAIKNKDDEDLFMSVVRSFKKKDARPVGLYRKGFKTKIIIVNDVAAENPNRNLAI